MKLADFHIGLEFIIADRRWRCTDVGTRVVVAIALEGYNDEAQAKLGPLKSEWFAGPPYVVCEEVFDESDLPVCEVAP